MRRVLLLVLSLSVTLLVVEFTLRATDTVKYRPIPPNLEDDTWGRLSFQPSDIPGLAYDLVPDSSRPWRRHQIVTNSHGMRDREPLPDADNLVRIAVLGDSFAFGWGLDARQAFPDMLETMLNDQTESVNEFDVLNFGVIGYSSRDEALVMEHKVVPFDPDLIVVGYVLNDPEIAPLQPLQAAFTPLEWWQHSHLLRLVAQARWQSEIRAKGGGDYFRYLYADEDSWQSVVGAFGRIRSIAADLDAPVLLVMFPQIPSPKEKWADYPYHGLHKQVEQLGLDNGFEVINLTPSFKTRRPRQYGVSALDRHPNWRGHLVAAQEIHQRMHERWPHLVASESLVTKEPEG